MSSPFTSKVVFFPSEGARLPYLLRETWSQSNEDPDSELPVRP